MDSRSIYTDCYDDPGYRMGAPRFARVCEAIRKQKHRGSLIDVGCGRGEILDAFEDEFEVVGGFEIVPSLCDGERIRAFHDITWIPMDTDTVDVVVCSDVLEHIERRDTIAALAELFRVSRHVTILHVAWFSHHWTLPNGDKVELHINRRELVEWLDLIHAVKPGCSVETIPGSRDALITVT